MIRYWVLLLLLVAGASLVPACSFGDDDDDPPPDTYVIVQLTGAPERASAVLHISPGGGMDFSVAGEAAWAADVLVMGIYRTVGGAQVVNLSTFTFDPVTNAATGSKNIGKDLAKAIGNSPTSYYMEIVTNASSPTPICNGTMQIFVAAALINIMTHAQEVPPTGGTTGRGAMVINVPTPTRFQYVFALGQNSTSEDVSDIVDLAIWDGPTGVAGVTKLIDFGLLSATVNPVNNTISRSLPITVEQYARLIYLPSNWHFNAISLAEINGLVRAQVTATAPSFSAGIDGANNVLPTVSTTETATFTMVSTMLSAGSVVLTTTGTLTGADILTASINEGDAATDGGPLQADILGGSGLVVAGNTITVSVGHSWWLLARMMADPSAFYIDVTYAGGAMRDQLSMP